MKLRLQAFIDARSGRISSFLFFLFPNEKQRASPILCVCEFDIVFVLLFQFVSLHQDLPIQYAEHFISLSQQCQACVGNLHCDATFLDPYPAQAHANFQSHYSFILLPQKAHYKGTILTTSVALFLNMLGTLLRASDSMVHMFYDILQGLLILIKAEFVCYFFQEVCEFFFFVTTQCQ